MILFHLRNCTHLNAIGGRIGVIHNSSNPIKCETRGGTNDSSWGKLSSVGPICLTPINRTLKTQIHYNLSF